MTSDGIQAPTQRGEEDAETGLTMQRTIEPLQYGVRPSNFVEFVNICFLQPKQDIPFLWLFFAAMLLAMVFLTTFSVPL